MIKIKYVGEESHQLAQIGQIEPGQIFNATEKQAAALEKHAPESYVRHMEAEAEKIPAAPQRVAPTAVEIEDEKDLKPVLPATPPKAKDVTKPGPKLV